jgi:hypothetical protein
LHLLWQLTINLVLKLMQLDYKWCLVLFCNFLIEMIESFKVMILLHVEPHLLLVLGASSQLSNYIRLILNIEDKVQNERLIVMLNARSINQILY